MNVASLHPRFVSAFLRADAGTFHEWVTRRESQLIAFCIVAIIAGAGTYGAVMGLWSCPLQALYAGIKLPLVILLTTLGNGLLNGMRAPLTPPPRRFAADHRQAPGGGAQRGRVSARCRGARAGLWTPCARDLCALRRRRESWAGITSASASTPAPQWISGSGMPPAPSRKSKSQPSCAWST